ncbi:TRAP transporter large permease subunit [Chelatococcus sp. SYSU_G07232]|uniref:TRAP transporter large permease subunit n=1 Tax=Chelatococcus albus TaxID=3047466 RepID=A0ABT7AI76_9HYPH|nr:TRAP transporter large permease subunit [Chelatococcus sp. SYSU_G07232]MDJ1159058.1 TRAP transporter large permease subunit [Chelatococcus sp. SYSU_G07232]
MALLCAIAIVFAAGFVLDWISIVLIGAPIVEAAGIAPLWFAVLFIVAIQTSYPTPPMAPSIFYLRSIAPADLTYGHMFRGVMPFVAMQLVTLGLVALFPSLATWLPKLLLG